MRVMLALLFLLCAYVAPSASSADEMPTAKEIRDRSAAAAGPVPENYRETIQIGGDFKTGDLSFGAEQRQTSIITAFTRNRERITAKPGNRATTA